MNDRSPIWLPFSLFSFWRENDPKISIDCVIQVLLPNVYQAQLTLLILIRLIASRGCNFCKRSRIGIRDALPILAVTRDQDQRGNHGMIHVSQSECLKGQTQVLSGRVSHPPALVLQLNFIQINCCFFGLRLFLFSSILFPNCSILVLTAAVTAFEARSAAAATTSIVLVWRWWLNRGGPHTWSSPRAGNAANWLTAPYALWL